MRAVLTLTLLLSFHLNAQVSDDARLDEFAENTIPVTEDNAEKSESLEPYTELRAHAIDLNSATPERLRALNMLSEIQIANFMHHRQVHGKLISVYELQTIDGFDVNTINRLKPLIIVNDPSLQINKDLLTRIKSESESYFLLRYDQVIQKKKGFTSAASENHRFDGPPGRIVWRYRMTRPGDFSFGITGENDAGEKFRWDPSNKKYGFDHVAFHLQLQNKGIIRNLILGDFQAQFGQGLVWGGGIGFGKGAETVINTRRPNVGFLPYTSAYEGGNLRGVATTIDLGRYLRVSGMFSRNSRDASIESDGEEETVTSLQSAGLHRNASELAKRKSTHETISGVVLQYERNLFSAGITFQDVRFESPVFPAKRVYNYHVFTGKQNQNAGAFLNFSRNNFTFFNEMASTLPGGMALTHGVLMSLSNRIDVSVLYRRFDKNYQSFYSHAFAESSRPQNESGFYWGFKCRLPTRLTYSGYFDMFQFPGLRYRVYSPSFGNEWFSRLQWQPSRTTTAFVQIRGETKWRNDSPASETVYVLRKYSKTNFWISLEYQPYAGLRMKTRFQGSTFRMGERRTSGYAMLQDAVYRRGKVTLTGRYALFHTEDFDNRQYVFENDVWLSFSMPAYYGVGMRSYAMIQYKINRTYAVWLRYSHTRYLDRDKIGSGADEIEGDTQNDVKFELRIKF